VRHVRLGFHPQRTRRNRANSAADRIAPTP
jgi:hypothetical protein